MPRTKKQESGAEQLTATDRREFAEFLSTFHDKVRLSRPAPHLRAKRIATRGAWRQRSPASADKTWRIAAADGGSPHGIWAHPHSGTAQAQIKGCGQSILPAASAIPSPAPGAEQRAGPCFFCLLTPFHDRRVTRLWTEAFRIFHRYPILAAPRLSRPRFSQADTRFSGSFRFAY
jgi:hypothetical protein